MKPVGQQLQEARAAKNWTPELAARETKIKVERIRDLENDDYTNFSSPTYARGFVRTYARALGLDEYKILRQLDTKLPEEETGNFVPEGGLPYVPEPSVKAMHVSSAPRTGLYVVLGLGFGVAIVIAFVLMQAYRAGELPRYFAATSVDSTLTSSAGSTTTADSEAPQHALPVDPNDTTHSVRALPVDLNALNAGGKTTAPAIPKPATGGAPASEPLATAPATTPHDAPPDAPLAVPPVTTATINNPAPEPETAPAANPAALPVIPPVVQPGSPQPVASDDTTHAPRALPVDPRELAAADPAIIPASTNQAPVATPADATAGPQGHRLVLTASHDSYVKVIDLDHPAHSVLYASVLRRGQTLSFGQKKYSLYVSIPAAVDILLDGVYYGPYSDRESPMTFPLESHQP